MSFISQPSAFILVAGALLGLFLSRFWYELDPARFAPFGDWPGAIGLAIVAAIFLAIQWWYALRRILAPDAILAAHIPFALLVIYILWPEVDLRLAAIVLLSAIGLAVALGVRAFVTSPPPRPPATPPPLLGLRPRRGGGVGGGGAALALTVFVLYLRTLGAHVGQADTFEFQVVAPQLGIAHPTGYPLYVLFGKLFSLLPIGSMAFRVNLTSTVFATAAAIVVYAAAARLGGRRLIAFIAALAFATSGITWSQAVVAEVYALNVLIVGVVIALSIDLASTPKGAIGEAVYLVPATFLLLGLGISHHLTAALLLPAIALAIAIARPRLPLRVTLIALGLFLLGLATWLYIPLRWPALHDGAPMALSEFLDWISGARFGGALDLSAWSDPARWSIVGRFLLDAFGPIGAMLTVVGFIGLARRHRPAALITLVTFAAYVFYGLVYNVPDVSVFLIPAFWIMAMWIGVGVTGLADALAARIQARSAQWLYAVSTTLFILIPIFLIGQNFSRVDQRHAGEQAEAWGRYVLSLPIPDGAAILVDSEKIAPLYYLQVTEGLRPDLDILVLGTEDEYRRELDARLAQDQPVYLARFLPNLPYHLRSLGPLVEVSNKISTETAGWQTTPKFGDTFDLVSLSHADGDPARVTFGWRALTDSRPNYHVRLRLVDDHGQVWWEDRGAHPVSGYYPTGAWAKGEVVADFHEIDFDPAIPPGAYILQVGLFPPFSEEGLPTDIGDVWWSVTQLVAPSVAAPSLDRTLRQVHGDAIAVSGVDSIGALPPSSAGQVRLNWARIGASTQTGAERSRRVRLSLTDAAGQVAWSGVIEPYGGALSVNTWPPGMLQTLLDFRTPDRDGVYTLRLGFVDGTGTSLPAKCAWLAPPSLDCPIGSVQVDGEAIGDAINFDNQVLLTKWSVDRTEMRPGEAVHVQLDWRGLKTWEADYTVTVQLIGPDGRLHGQVDAWPVQGTLPTSAWAAGQTVSDGYVVMLRPDAPVGRYRVEVGWYLLATLRRMPVLDAGGQPIDDRVVVGEFSVP